MRKILFTLAATVLSAFGVYAAVEKEDGVLVLNEANFDE
jgi:hypothetical protein